MIQEQRDCIQSALKLQGELKINFMKHGLNEKIADDLAGMIMDTVLLSDVVKPEIKAIYEELSK